MAKTRWYNKLFQTKPNPLSWIRNLVSGSLYRISDMNKNSVVSDIKTQIDTMKALAEDSQINTALSYYATDATTTNSSGQMIWASPKDTKDKEIADLINDLFIRWDLNSYVRDHILELATYGNLYIPTTGMYYDNAKLSSNRYVKLDNNTVPEDYFDIIPSYHVPPEDILHVYYRGKSLGYIVEPDENTSQYQIHPDESCIHFSLGGLLGKYKIDVVENNVETSYDIKFAEPLMARAVQPTQTLGLLEDALLLSSLIRNVKFINVECGNAEEIEIQSILQQIKDAIEQQMSLHTGSGDAQSFVNPQSPKNLIYLPKINGQDAISITDLDMSDTNSEDSALLNHFQDKKLSVLGVPKEAMNFSSNEGLGGAGSVLSQRSALYANCLQRLKTAYISGWTDALNTYFTCRGMSGFVNRFQLHMTDIITEQSTITFERRDSAIGQAQNIVALLRDCGVTDADAYLSTLIEILTDVLPVTSSKISNWDINTSEAEDAGGAGGGVNF